MIASSDERPLIKITSSATPNRARFFFKSLMMFLLDQLKGLTTEEMSRHVDAQIVELTWLIGHFCLLNRWFTVLQVPDESPQDEWNFAAAYEEIVPEQIRRRNDQMLAGGF